MFPGQNRTMHMVLVPTLNSVSVLLLAGTSSCFEDSCTVDHNAGSGGSAHHGADDVDELHGGGHDADVASFVKGYVC